MKDFYIKHTRVFLVSLQPEMAKLFIFFAVLLLLQGLLKCSATVYIVGDSAGWDISTNLDSWSKDKTFSVGDTLLFQYSQYHSICEATKESYEGCNTTNVLQSSSTGNTSFPLTSPGNRYFFCGHRLHCLGGMKLHVSVPGVAGSPVGAPSKSEVPPGGALPPGSSKANQPTNSGIPSRIRMDGLQVLTVFGSIISCLAGLMF